jgi:hypothetical protein
MGGGPMSATFTSVYGPRYGQANLREALKKVNEDFRGAHAHWQDLLKKWWFVVGLYRDKLAPEILRLMAQLTNELKVPSEILHRGDVVALARDIDAKLRAKMFGGHARGRGDMTRRATYENIGLGRRLNRLGPSGSSHIGGSQVRSRLTAGGSKIRTLGSA